MTEFVMPKSLEETGEPVEVPDGTYTLRLVKPAYAQDSKAGDSQNIVLELAITGEGEPLDGIELRYFMNMPKPGDDERKTSRGQTIMDFKLQQIAKNIVALGGEVDGNKFIIPEGAMCKANLENRANDSGEKFPNIVGNLMPASRPKKRKG